MQTAIRRLQHGRLFSRSCSHAPLQRGSVCWSRRYASTTPSIIPVIDLGGYWEGSALDKQRVAKEINRACTDIGFLTVTGHRVPKQTIDNAFAAIRSYFDLDLSEKSKIPMTEDYPFGYSAQGEENLSGGYDQGRALPDLKEMFGIGTYNPLAEMPEQRWPEKPPQFHPALHEYFMAMENLSSELLKCFALALDLEETWFNDKIDKHRSCLRVINYPEQTVEPLPGQIRAGEHTDYGSLTILAQDGVAGLEAKDRNGKWHPVVNVEDSFIINIGDLMAMWTNDKWVSTPHRVMNTSKARRHSMAFFHNINGDHLVECIPTCKSDDNPPKHPPIKAWEHLIQKHLASQQ